MLTVLHIYLSKWPPHFHNKVFLFCYNQFKKKVSLIPTCKRKINSFSKVSVDICIYVSVNEVKQHFTTH